MGLPGLRDTKTPQQYPLWFCNSPFLGGQMLYWALGSLCAPLLLEDFSAPSIPSVPFALSPFLSSWGPSVLEGAASASSSLASSGPLQLHPSQMQHTLS